MTQTIYVVSHKETKVRKSLYGQRRESYEYFPDYYKIGIAESPEKRLSVLKGGTPHKLELVTTIESEDAKKVESYLHGINSFYRKKGEWFDPPINMVNSLIAISELQPENAKILERMTYTHDWDHDKGLYVCLMEVRKGAINLDSDGLVEP